MSVKHAYVFQYVSILLQKNDVKSDLKYLLAYTTMLSNLIQTVIS